VFSFLVFVISQSGFGLSKSLISKLDRATHQLILVKAKGGVTAELVTLEVKNGNWAKINTFSAVVGQKSFAKIGEKLEGDSKTPSGIYELNQAWGYSESFPTLMPYRQATSEDKFVDDVNSNQYNTWVHGSTQAKSYEDMLRKDDLYKFGVVIDYNMNPVVSGKGSAIFLHIWRSADRGTAGCVAIEEKNLVKILKWLEPSKKPKIALNIE
jgi:L,D-peptidoglycan transpeptidase YkuD (ErfK/YbiS/YcfS/YnhG family)